ncbi:unnamed protein product [Peronospora destructor]|uniref:Uncharacterized protein n=1 Tax=Peronospora destructor TaxID=86335 RepID=A0AAV0VA55_9STRA|nr:unnamed protein product [Peronospora destructor]
MGFVSCVALNPQGSLVATGSHGTGSERAVPSHGRLAAGAPPDMMALSVYGMWLLASACAQSSPSQQHLWEVRRLHPVDVKFSMQCAFLEQQWNKQPVVACRSEDNRIFMWDVGMQDVCSVLTGHDHPVLALAAHPTRALVVSGSNRDIKMWIPTSETDGISNSDDQNTGISHAPES